MVKTNHNKRVRSNFRNKRQTQKRKVRHTLRSKTYSKSKRSFQTGGTIPLNWTLEECKVGVKATVKNSSNNKFSYSFKKSEPVTSTSKGAFGISFTKSLFFDRRGRGTLTIEIDIDKYRHNILKLVNAILQRLFDTEVNAFTPEPEHYDFDDIASYDNFYNHHQDNIEERDAVFADSDPVKISCNLIGMLTDQNLKPLRHCIIEIDIQFADNETIIHSIKYTSFEKKTKRCSKYEYTADGEFTYWSPEKQPKTLKKETKLPFSSVPRQSLETFYDAGGNFYVSTVVFYADTRNQDFEQNKPTIPTIYEFDKPSFDEKKAKQNTKIDEYIQTTLPAAPAAPAAPAE
jgi:hypothetical protein